jgi:hypothetical protein
MADDIVFNDANINAYDDIPSSRYGTLSGVALANVEIGHSSKKIINDTLADGSGAFFTWSYPAADNLFVHVAVGYHLQVLEGSLNEATAQESAPGVVVHEQIVNLNTLASPNNYINLASGGVGKYNMPSGTLRSGSSYAVRVRSLVFSEKGAGVVGGEYHKYTEWGYKNFRVNSPPAALNLRVNGSSNPTRLKSTDPVVFSFTFDDADGPNYLYRVQVGTSPGGGFSANVWDSGLISGGSALGTREFEIRYAGPALSQGVTYAWRIQVQDGLSDGGYTAAFDTFRVNRAPTVASMKVSGSELLYPCPAGVACDPPMLADSGLLLEWEMSDDDDDEQKAWALRLVQSADDGTSEITFPVTYSDATSIALPTLPQGAIVTLHLSLRDDTEFGPESSGTFFVNAKPDVLDLEIDGASNNGAATSVPTFEWRFFDETAGDTQQGYQIQVATNEDFSSLVWDTGEIVSSATSVVYGSTPSPAVAPAALSHGVLYFARVRVSDGTSFSDYATGFFSVNTKPGSPMLLTPTVGAYSGAVAVSWIPASPEDSDGDTVTYSIEITDRRSTNQGWRFVAGPLAADVTSYSLDTSVIKAGNDYGVRVVANDGFADSDPALGTSGVNSLGLGFTILNHAPTTPTFVRPATAAVVSKSTKIEWLEASVPDVDGDAVFYIVEITRESTAASPTWETVAVVPDGTSSLVLDVSRYEDGSDYQLRITAMDSKGGVGEPELSGVFSVANATAVNDFETFGGKVYMGTSDGRLVKATEAIWQVDEDWSSGKREVSFEEFKEGAPEVKVEGGRLKIKSPAGSTYVLRQTGRKN